MSDLVNDLRQRATEVHPLDGSLPLLLQAANELAALKLENEKLVELAVGAKSFSQHHHSCSSLFGFGPRPCTCGLTTLRAEIERVKGKTI